MNHSLFIDVYHFEPVCNGQRILYCSFLIFTTDSVDIFESINWRNVKTFGSQLDFYNGNEGL